MNGFDIVALVIIAGSGLLAMARGFVREVLSIAALIVGVLGALWGFPVFRDGVREAVDPGWLADIVTFGGIFLAIYIAVTLVTIQIHKAIHTVGPIGFLDRSAGFGFGLVRGFVVIGLLVIVMRAAFPAELVPKWLTEARLYPIASLTADGMVALAPVARDKAGELAASAAEAGEAERERREAEEDPADRDADRESTMKDGADEKGYAERDRTNLDRLIGDEAEKR